VGGGRCGALRRLSLKLNGLGDAGLRALVGGGALGALEALQVSHNTIRDEGVEALALGWPVGLARLDLEGNFVSAEGLRALRRPAAARALGWLNVDHNQLEEGAWDFFGEAPLEALVTLSARHNRLGRGWRGRWRGRRRWGGCGFWRCRPTRWGMRGRGRWPSGVAGELACLEVERCQVGGRGRAGAGEERAAGRAVAAVAGAERAGRGGAGRSRGVERAAVAVDRWSKGCLRPVV
jgi:hypothetical protein